MNYSGCISIAMAAINYSLEQGQTYAIGANLNFARLSLEKPGFILEEECRFDSDFTFGQKRISVSPSFVIKTIFGSSTGNSITKVAKTLSNSEVKNQISYTQLIHLLDKMRNSFLSGNINSSIVDMNYFKLKQILRQRTKDDYFSLKNQVLSLSDLSYESLVNIRNINPDIARKMERLYQLEHLLEVYSKTNILLQEGKIDTENDWYINYHPMFKDIDLTEYRVTWNDFCHAVHLFNQSVQEEQTSYFEKNSEARYTKLTVLGLDELILPGTPMTPVIGSKIR